MTPKSQAEKSHFHPFRVAVLRGLAVLLPPLLTIAIFLWAGATVNDYILRPVSHGTRDLLVWGLADIRRLDEFPAEEQDEISAKLGDTTYRRLSDGTTVTFVPASPVYQLVAVDAADAGTPMPNTGIEVYQRYVELRYLRPWVVLPFFASIFIVLVYLLGKFMAAGLGRMLWNLFESGVRRVPLVRNVYSSVKQVSDFLLSEREFDYSRVVAVEYPRKGIWSLGLVTSNSMRDIEAAANEPVLAVLICTSPMPMTGFTVTVRKSETIDLNLTIDQAFQFVISCGVVIPPQQISALRSQSIPIESEPEPSEASQ